MQKTSRKFMNLFVAITLAAFIISAIPTSVLAASPNAETSIAHFDGQKHDKSPSHQRDRQCGDDCCASHCFHCAGFAIPATQPFSVPSISSARTLFFSDQKAEGSPIAPQLRPPRHLA